MILQMELQVNNEQVKKYLLSKPEAALYHPFGDDVEVYRVKHKMFATLSLGKGTEKEVGSKMEGHYCVNLKCDSEEAIMLRDIFPSVIPGYHMNKRHWNTIILDGSIPQGEIERMIDNSFMLVVGNMSKQDQQSITIKM